MSRTHLHNMMTSSNGNIFRATRPLCGEFTGPGEIPAQRPVTRTVHVFFDLRLNKRLIKQPWGWWFETPSWSLWRHCNEFLFSYIVKNVYVHKYLKWNIWNIVVYYNRIKNVITTLMTEMHIRRAANPQKVFYLRSLMHTHPPPPPPYTLSLQWPSYSKFSQLSYEPGCSHELWCRKCATWLWNEYALFFSKILFYAHIQRYTATAGTKCYKTM